ncbi:MAG: hypothetical protein BWY57_02090 [Betaproteobacteria bacterium ADurb.Bin341]|nr:MAG: hypothetical protein BWY57_02090 [Betaproteobacteria bacterium ADurb.Bin341]
MPEATQQPAPLLPIDYIFTGVGAYPVEFVFYYDYAIDAERFTLVLKKTLTDFHLVSSQLQESGDANAAHGHRVAGSGRCQDRRLLSF